MTEKVKVSDLSLGDVISGHASGYLNTIAGLHDQGDSAFILYSNNSGITLHKDVEVYRAIKGTPQKAIKVRAPKTKPE